MDGWTDILHTLLGRLGGVDLKIETDNVTEKISTT